MWEWYIRYKGVGPFQAGDYVFRENSAMSDAVSVLEAGPAAAKSRQFTIPEGLTTAETLDRLANPEDGLGFERDAMQQLLDSGRIRSRYQPPEQPSAEGILFPDTYDIDAEADAAARSGAARGPDRRHPRRARRDQPRRRARDGLPTRSSSSPP